MIIIAINWRNNILGKREEEKTETVPLPLYCSATVGLYQICRGVCSPPSKQPRLYHLQWATNQQSWTFAAAHICQEQPSNCTSCEDLFEIFHDSSETLHITSYPATFLKRMHMRISCAYHFHFHAFQFHLDCDISFAFLCFLQIKMQICQMDPLGHKIGLSFRFKGEFFSSCPGMRQFNIHKELFSSKPKVTFYPDLPL